MSNRIFFSYSFLDDSDLKITKIKTLIESFKDSNGNKLYDVFMASDPIDGNTSGRSWNSQEKNVMLNSFLIILFLSENSISSNGVSEEIDFYFNKMRKNKRNVKFLYISLTGINYADTIFKIMESDEYLNDIELETTISKFEKFMGEPDFQDHHLYIKYNDSNLKKRLESTIYELYLGFNKIVKPKESINKNVESERVLDEKKTISINDNPESRKKYDFVPYELLIKDYKVTDKSIQEIEEDKSLTIKYLLKEYGILGDVTKYSVGCQFTSYEINAPISELRKIETDLKYRLNFELVLNKYNENSTSLMLPNKNKNIFYLKDAINDKYLNDDKPLLVPIGKDVNNKIRYDDISKYPHLLIGGIAGSGKTSFVNSLLISLLTKNDSTKLRICICDTRRVEYLPYAGIPHMITNIVDNRNDLSSLLEWLSSEIERRYSKFMQAFKTNINQYNKNLEEKLDYILCVIDDFSHLSNDLTNEDKKNIQKILTLGRAAGVHMVIVTSSLDTSTIPGILKVNIPTRIAFKVASPIDSRSVLDDYGAESLLGRGDMIINDGIKKERLQAPFVDSKSISSVCDYLKSNNDYLFERIALFCVKKNSCRAFEIQAEFLIGFNRAMSIIKKLEDMNIVSEKDFNGNRRILVDESQLIEILNNI